MQSVEDAIRQTEFYSDETDYWLIQLPANAITVAAGVVAEAGQAFSALLIDKDEVTLMLRDDVFTVFEKRLRGHQKSEFAYRLITFEMALDLTLVGFMARISACLADAEVPIMVYAAYSRDHLFVPVAQYDAAMNALKNLQDTLTHGH